MASKHISPSVGLNAATGGTLTGWPHVVQSLQDIFTTQFGTRIMREWYGSFVPNLLGRTITPKEVTPWFAAVTSAIEQWEPRYRITRIQVLEVTRDGQLHFFMEGEYRPRAVFGDFTVEGARRIDAYANPDGVLIDQRVNEG
jgi:phage baseplate assembly protein W